MPHLSQAAQPLQLLQSHARGPQEGKHKFTRWLEPSGAIQPFCRASIDAPRRFRSWNLHIRFLGVEMFALTWSQGLGLSQSSFPNGKSFRCQWRARKPEEILRLAFLRPLSGFLGPRSSLSRVGSVKK